MNRILGTAVAGCAALLAASAQAQAVDTGLHAGDILVRLRAIVVAPNEKSGGITPTFPAEQVKIDNSYMPEVDFTYMATDAIGFELIASTTKHHASGTSGTTGSIGRLASTWVLPPTLTAQYHFNAHGSVRPYVGAGINYTIFWNEKAAPGLVAAVGPTKVGMSDSVGWAAQGGLDIDLTRKIFANFDVKYIDIRTNARLATTAIGTQTVHVKLDPLVFGMGLGMRF